MYIPITVGQSRQELQTKPFSYGWGVTGYKTASSLIVAGLGVLITSALYPKVMPLGLFSFIPLVTGIILSILAFGRSWLYDEYMKSKTDSTAPAVDFELNILEFLNERVGNINAQQQ